VTPAGEGSTRDRRAARLRLALLASGRGSNVEAILEAIRDSRLDAEAVVLVCDRPGAPVIGVARRFRVPVELVTRAAFPSRAAQQARIAELLVAHRVDVVALAGFEAILSDVVVDRFPGRILNIHPSLLPAFAGMIAPEPQAAALRAGVSESGCTVHVVTAEVDAGPIVAQARVPILPGDTVETLSARILDAERRLYPEVLQRFADGPTHPVPPPNVSRSGSGSR
jgi:phosphoribosylglycinamide formyltransferase-1